MLVKTAGIAVLLAGCAHPAAQRQSAPATPATPTSAPGPAVNLTSPSPATAEPVVKPVEFARDVRPILESRCQPCHFEGGRMYERLPFDRAETIRQLGPKLFTRIKDEESQATIRRFLSQPAADLQ
jgi:hypothetical protein